MDNAIEHYVPQSYLRRFAIKDAADQVWVFDKTQQAAFLSNVRNVAAEKGFFGELDSVYGELDDASRDWLDSLIETIENTLKARQVLSIEDELRGSISYLAAIQSLRTKESRRVLLDVAKHTAAGEALLGRINPASYHFYRAFDHRFVKFLADHINASVWAVGIGSEDNPFHTSDNPIILMGEHTDFDTVFPLTPKYMLACKGKATATTEKVSTDYYSLVSDEMIRKVNELQAENCNKFIFSSLDNFEFTREFLRLNPALTNPNRDRVQMKIFDDDLSES